MNGRFIEASEGADKKDCASKHPFVAAFGNAPTDLLSYYCVGMPLDRIFTLNKKSEIKSGNIMQPLKEIDVGEYKLGKKDGLCLMNWIEALNTSAFMESIVGRQLNRDEREQQSQADELPVQESSPTKLAPRTSATAGDNVATVPRGLAASPTSPNEKKKKKSFWPVFQKKNEKNAASGGDAKEPL